MYELRFDKKFLSSLKKLPSDIQQRAISKLRSAADNPHRLFIRLTNSDLYKLRVGDYRILATIDDGILEILVLSVKYRKRVYKQL